MRWIASTSKIYLRNDFSLKESYKEEGAVFDSEVKRWYIPAGDNPLKFRWLRDDKDNLKDTWTVLECPFEDREIVKNKGAYFDRKIKKWTVPKDLDCDDFCQYWPKDLKKFLFQDGDRTFSVWWELASSGQSIVFDGFEVGTDQRVAIKIFENSDEFQSRVAFNRETKIYAEVLNKLPGILNFRGWGKHELSGQVFIITDYCKWTLSDLIGLTNQKLVQKIMHEDEQFHEYESEEQEEIIAETVKYLENDVDQWTESLDDLLPVLDTLCVALDKGVIHRDLKPSNIFVRFNSSVFDEEADDKVLEYLIGDFGTSKILDEVSRASKTMVSIGSPVYSPLLNQKREQYQKTRDVYSWAAILVAVACNEDPKNDKRLRKLLNTKFKKLVPDGAHKLISSCLSEDPEDSPKDVKVLRKALQKYIP